MGGEKSRERESEWGAPGERENKGGCCPPLDPAQRPHLGAPGLAAGHVAAPGGAGHRKRKEGAAAPSTEPQEGALPPSSKETRGAVAPLQQRERGFAPLSGHAQGPRWAPGCPRPPATAGGAQDRGGSGHPEEKRGRGSLGFGVFFVVVELEEMGVVVGVFGWRRW